MKFRSKYRKAVKLLADTARAAGPHNALAHGIVHGKNLVVTNGVAAVIVPADQARGAVDHGRDFVVSGQVLDEVARAADKWPSGAITLNPGAAGGEQSARVERADRTEGYTTSVETPAVDHAYATNVADCVLGQVSAFDDGKLRISLDARYLLAIAEAIDAKGEVVHDNQVLPVTLVFDTKADVQGPRRHVATVYAGRIDPVRGPNEHGARGIICAVLKLPGESAL